MGNWVFPRQSLSTLSPHRTNVHLINAMRPSHDYHNYAYDDLKFFSWTKMFAFRFKFYRRVFQGFNWQWVSSSVGDGKTPDRLQWRHNRRDNISNHQPHDCLLNRLIRHISKKTPKLRVPGLCAGNSPGTGEFPAQMARYAENVSIWWRHHAGNNPFPEQKYD